MHSQNTRLRAQRGGTMVGLIIGLLAGLGIALAVALAITKTPMIFTNKLVRPDRPDAAANQSTDPNRPLYGKNAGREALKQAAKAPPEVPPAVPSSAAETAPPPNQVIEKKPDPKPDEKIAAIQLFSGDQPKKPEAKISDAPEAQAKAASAEDKWNYFLQAGAFREQTDAENTRAKLALMGVEARVTERPSENGTLYRVRIGPFAQLEALNKVRGKLSDNGVDAAVVRISK
jgi:cell division protein FtsN